MNKLINKLKLFRDQNLTWIISKLLILFSMYLKQHPITKFYTLVLNLHMRAIWSFYISLNFRIFPYQYSLILLSHNIYFYSKLHQFNSCNFGPIRCRQILVHLMLKCWVICWSQKAKVRLQFLKFFQPLSRSFIPL